MIDRRSICMGAAAALAACAAQAEPDKPVFVSGPMASNALAVSFRAPPASVVLPATALVSAQGPAKLSELAGRTWLLSLWAEWCAPCLEEATDLAAIARTHAGPSFGVIFVLSGSAKKLDLAGAHALLVKREAGDAPLFVEPNGGAAVAKALAGLDSGFSFPCNVLVDRHGRVRARSFGATSVIVRPAGAVSGSRTMTDADKARALTQHTVWATPQGSEFAAALAAGLLG